MGLRLSFGFGPLRYSKSLRKRRRSRGRYFYGYRADGGRCPHRHQSMAAAEECTRKARGIRK
jgi:hypothetical protein